MNDSPHLPIEVVGQFMQKVPVDVRALGSALGLKITEANLPDNVSGKIERDWRGSYVVVVNQSHSTTRKRFTIAHEIAHYVLHKDKIGDGIVDDGLYRDSRLSSAVERQANRYAAEILMPWPKVVDGPDFRSGNVSSLAVRYGVSLAVAEIRVRELDAVS